jgi:hypothetical protein
MTADFEPQNPKPLTENIKEIAQQEGITPREAADGVLKEVLLKIKRTQEMGKVEDTEIVEREDELPSS